MNLGETLVSAALTHTRVLQPSDQLLDVDIAIPIFVEASEYFNWPEIRFDDDVTLKTE